jgi:hypothetical protein
MTLAGAFAAQADACERLGSPLTGRVLRLAGARVDPGSAVGQRLATWPGDMSAAGDAVALRLAGGLHALVLSGRAPDLAAAYAGAGDSALGDALAAVLEREAAHLLTWLDRPPQTNEVRRAAVAIAGAGLIARETGGRPVEWLELGASAGLNLHWDAYALRGPGWRRGAAGPVLELAPDWHGPPPPEAPPIAARAGVDLHPADPGRDALRLLAYVWADQADRLERTRAALSHAAGQPRWVEAGDAGDWLAARLAGPPAPGTVRVVFHAIAWQYFPPATRDRARAAMADAKAPLFQLAMEADGRKDSAALTVTRWPEGTTLPLGRADFHGRRIDWQPP